jgi:hypothetical protein
MSKSKKNTRNRSKPSVKVQDLPPQTDPKGGETKTLPPLKPIIKPSREYLKVELENVIVTN